MELRNCISAPAPSPDLNQALLLLCSDLAINSVAVRLTKRAAVRGDDADAQVSLELAATYQGVAQNTADHDEAVLAMLERRTPKFHGK